MSHGVGATGHSTSVFRRMYVCLSASWFRCSFVACTNFVLNNQIRSNVEVRGGSWLLISVGGYHLNMPKAHRCI